MQQVMANITLKGQYIIGNGIVHNEQSSRIKNDPLGIKQKIIFQMPHSLLYNYHIERGQPLVAFACPCTEVTQSHG